MESKSSAIVIGKVEKVEKVEKVKKDFSQYRLFEKFVPRIIQLDLNEETWKFFMQIATIILNVEGVIFGGFPRDVVRRMYAQEQIKNGSQDPMDLEDSKLLPKDIDAFFRRYNNLSDVLPKKLKANKILYELTKTLNDSYVEDGKIIVKQYKLTKFITNKICVSIMLDAIYDDEVVNIPGKKSNKFPPFVKQGRSSLDLECNCLYLRGTFDIRLLKGVYGHLGPEDHIHIIDSIRSNIKNKRTRIIQRINSSITHSYSNARLILIKRIIKMLKRGWIIEGNRSYILLPKSQDVIDLTNDSKCAICITDISETSETDKHNDIFACLKCCNKPFHVSCLEIYVKSEITGYLSRLTPRCPCCRADLDMFGCDISAT